MTSNTEVSKGLKYSLLFFLLFFLAIASIVVLQNHKNGFFLEGHHGNTSSLAATLSKSLIVEKKHLVMLINKQLFRDGETYYNPYNRFPVFEYILTGMVMRIFEPNLSMQIYMARQVMNIFFIASLVMCFLIIREILDDIFLAMFLSLLIFSSYYMLYYNDMISNMSTPLCGFLLALYLFLKNEKGSLRKPKLILLSILSIALGWQSYAVFIAWFVVDTIKLIREKKKVGRIVKAVIYSPSFFALTLSIVFGSIILGAQVVNEWSVRGGGFFDLPNIEKIMGRFNLRQYINESQQHVSKQPANVELYMRYAEWHYFLLLQAFRVFVMTVPFAGILISKVKPFNIMFFVPGLLFTLVTGPLFIYALVSFRKKINLRILSVFVLSGVCWAFPLRYYVTWHDHQSPFYIGSSIMYFVVLGYLIKKNISKKIAIVVCLLFIFSVYQMNEIKSVAAVKSNAVTADFQNIHEKLPKYSKVFVDCPGRFGTDRFGMDVCRNEISADLGLGGHSLDFFLVGHFRTFKENADYIISMNPDYGQKRLTDNPQFNLFKVVRK